MSKQNYQGKPKGNSKYAQKKKSNVKRDAAEAQERAREAAREERHRTYGTPAGKASANSGSLSRHESGGLSRNFANTRPPAHPAYSFNAEVPAQSLITKPVLMATSQDKWFAGILLPKIESNWRHAPCVLHAERSDDGAWILTRYAGRSNPDGSFVGEKQLMGRIEGLNELAMATRLQIWIKDGHVSRDVNYLHRETPEIAANTQISRGFQSSVPGRWSWDRDFD